MRKILFIFGELNDFDLDWILANGVKEQISQDALLIKQGRPIDKLFIILEGSFKVSVTGPQEREIARMGAGEVVGEISFVESRPPSATVTALANSLVWSIPRTQLAAKLKEDTGFAARFYKALAVLLSFRLRRSVSLLGYGKDQALDEAAESPDELDNNILDTVYLAGARFDRMLRRVTAM